MLVAEDLSVGPLRLCEGRFRPSQRHLAVLPGRHSPDLLPGPGVRAIDEIRAAQTPPERCRQPQAVDGEHLAEPFPQAGRR